MVAAAQNQFPLAAGVEAVLLAVTPAASPLAVAAVQPVATLAVAVATPAVVPAVAGALAAFPEKVANTPRRWADSHPARRGFTMDAGEAVFSTERVRCKPIEGGGGIARGWRDYC